MSIISPPSALSPFATLHFSINLNIRREFFLVFLIFAHHLYHPSLGSLVHIRRDFFIPHFAIYASGGKNAIYCDYADIELVKKMYSQKKSPSFEAEMKKTGWGYMNEAPHTLSGFLEHGIAENCFFYFWKSIQCFDGGNEKKKCKLNIHTSVHRMKWCIEEGGGRVGERSAKHYREMEKNNADGKSICEFIHHIIKHRCETLAFNNCDILPHKPRRVT